MLLLPPRKCDHAAFRAAIRRWHSIRKLKMGEKRKEDRGMEGKKEGALPSLRDRKERREGGGGNVCGYSGLSAHASAIGRPSLLPKTKGGGNFSPSSSPLPTFCLFIFSPPPFSILWPSEISFWPNERTNELALKME